MKEEFTIGVMRDFINLALESKIGSGMGRDVYHTKLYGSDVVIKIESNGASFQNVMEWEAWNRVNKTEFAKWFAPCVAISPTGSILVQRKTEPMQREQYPSKMPAFLSDFKYQNYGWLDGQIVCHDYGTHLLMEQGMTKRMRKAEWWDANDA